MKVWKCIPEFGDLYEISNIGELRRVKTQFGKAINRVHTPFFDKNGTVIYNLCKDGIRYRRPASRLVASAHIRALEDFEIVIHKDGNIVNNNVDNLEIATPTDLYTKLVGCEKIKVFNPKSVYCIETNTHYKSIKSAAKELKLDYSYLRYCLFENKPCHGYTFIRKETN